MPILLRRLLAVCEMPYSRVAHAFGPGCCGLWQTPVPTTAQWQSGWQLPPWSSYHAAKTGSLFEAAVELGALCGGAEATTWSATGRRIGAAYQVVDDLIDVLGADGRHGKPVGVDAALGRPNIVSDLGVDGARARLVELIDALLESLPECPAPNLLRARILEETNRWLPPGVHRSAA